MKIMAAETHSRTPTSFQAEIGAIYAGCVVNINNFHNTKGESDRFSWIVSCPP